MYEVMVSEEYQHSTARVAGRIFSKRGVELIHEHEMIEEILNSPVLSVVKVEVEVDREPGAAVDATNGARALAEEVGIDLAVVQGTGQEGRITKADVEAYIAAVEEEADET